jgi:hypothetical protein
MNKNTFACAVVFCSFLAVSSRAVPVGTSNTEIDYTISAQSFHNWCWGIYGESKKPNVAWVLARDFILDQVNQQAQPMVPSLKQLLQIFDTQANRDLGYGPLIELAVEPGLLKIPGAGEKFDKISQLAQAEVDLIFIGEKTAQQAAEDVCPVIDEELAVHQ